MDALTPSSPSPRPRWDRPLLVAIALIAVVLLLRGCAGLPSVSDLLPFGSHPETADVVVPIRADSAGYYRNRFGEVVATNRNLQLDNEKLLDRAISAETGLQHLRQDFKHVQAAVVVRTVTEIRNDTIPFAEPVPCHLDLPFARAKLEPGTADTLYQISGRATDAGLVLTRVAVPARLSLMVGEPTGGGLFRAASTEVRAVSDNPYVQVTGLASVMVRPKPTMLQKVAQVTALVVAALCGAAVAR